MKKVIFVVMVFIIFIVSFNCVTTSKLKERKEGAASTMEKRESLGSEENPVKWWFIPTGDKQRVTDAADSLVKLLCEKTGLYFETKVATEYAGVIEALSSKPPEAHIAYMSAFAYIIAADRGVAEATLVSVRYGKDFYNAQIIANANSGVSKIADIKGKTFARPDPLSTSGWIFPMLVMWAAGIDPEKDLNEIVDTGSHRSVVDWVYYGDVSAGATYVDTRTELQKVCPDVIQKVKVIEISPNIPNDGVQFHPSVPEEMREKIVDALLEIANTKAGKEALNTAYGCTGLEMHNDTFYDPFRQLLQASSINLQALWERALNSGA